MHHDMSTMNHSASVTASTTMPMNHNMSHNMNHDMHNMQDMKDKHHEMTMPASTSHNH